MSENPRSASPTPVHQFRFDLATTLVWWCVIPTSVVVAIYLGAVWPPGGPPWWWWPRVPAVVGSVLLSLLGCAFIFRRRMFDRSPQLELYTDFLRAKQIGDVDILWANVRGIRAFDRIGGAEEIGMNTRNRLLVLDVEGMGAVELNLDGLGVPAGHILGLVASVRPEFRKVK